MGKQRKNLKSYGLNSPCARAMAMIAAASITQDKGFHIKPKNFSTLFS